MIVADQDYSELCIADERIAFKVPESISLEQAATIPLAADTAYLALFSSDCLHIDPKSPPSAPVLILGGSCKSHSKPAPSKTHEFQAN